MIKLATFMPEYFNNNGDQGNIAVLQRQLRWRGVDCSVSSNNLLEADFVLVGDASRAVMREFEAELVGLKDVLSERLRLGRATLLVGSAHEFFCEKIPGLPKLAKSQRSSEFREATSNGVSVFGYRNSEVILDLFIEGAFISTTLYGPVLAKNSQLLMRVLESMGITQKLPAGIQEGLDSEISMIRLSALGR